VPQSIVVAGNDSEKIGMLSHLFGMEGFQVVPLYIPRFQDRDDQFGDFLTQHSPNAVLYEIGHPYKQSWEFFKQLRTVDQAQGITFFVTSLGKQYLETDLGEGEVRDVLDLSDPREIVDMVTQHMSEREGQHFAVRGERGF
jgi:DNA-binding response OmpR family regulator